MKERLSPYDIETDWRKGEKHVVPDTPSCAPISDPSLEDIEVETESSSWIHRTVRLCAIDLDSPSLLPSSLSLISPSMM